MSWKSDYLKSKGIKIGDLVEVINCAGRVFIGELVDIDPVLCHIKLKDDPYVAFSPKDAKVRKADKGSVISMRQHCEFQLTGLHQTGTCQVISDRGIVASYKDAVSLFLSGISPKDVSIKCRIHIQTAYKIQHAMQNLGYKVITYSDKRKRRRAQDKLKALAMLRSDTRLTPKKLAELCNIGLRIAREAYKEFIGIHGEQRDDNRGIQQVEAR